MFDNLTERLSGTLNKLRGQGRLTEDNIQSALREVRMALLEADVALPVARGFVGRVRERALGQEVMKSLTPGQTLIRIVRDELTGIMGGEQKKLELSVRPPAVILLAGLQGSGKTTTAGKLARWLKERDKKRVMVTSADVYRPAAIDQLETLASEVGVDWFPSRSDQEPVAIAKDALAHARTQSADVLIIDTAGRLAVDEKMMTEIRRLHEATEPAETLFVVDAMTGQDAANTAKAFGDALPLSGVVLTKIDGDARGGAALSVVEITGAPVKFVGQGERSDALEPFYPDRMAARILGMGDMLGLIEEAEHKIDQEQSKRLASKLKKGKGFDLEDFREQLLQMGNMGGVGSLMEKLPGMGELPDSVRSQVNDKDFKRMEAIINSMTPQERRRPDVIRGSRKRRIANGSGTQVQDVNRLLKQFTQMQKMMKKMSKKGGMKNLMRGMKGQMPGGMPPGF